MRLTDASVNQAAHDSKRPAGDDLVAILRLAYSGELAAALAYRGHWKSVSDAEDRRRIRQIEEEEWHHRGLVGAMLRDLGESPGKLREVRAWLIGRALGLLCHVSGWLAPMYGAGKLESRNVREYEAAARHALACGRDEWVDCLLTMAEVEWEHEAFFRSRVLSHRVGRRLPIWPAPPPKEAIRESFERDARALRGRRLTFAGA
jgi:demethoxyubiquinone hydroxylase (CLK1/Coq7/Cat5 family)